MAIPKEVMDLIKPGEEQMQNIKVLATADEKGVPHAIILGSLMAIDEDTLAFALVWSGTTYKNLETTKEASVVVFKPPMTAYRLQCCYEETITSGGLFDRFVDELKKFNLECKGVVKMKVAEVYTAGPPAPGQKVTC